MHNIVLYCKSYKPDLGRVIQLNSSIQRYNVDNIPFYISVPDSDYTLFKERLNGNITVIKDSEICDTNKGWVGQQIVKSQFWKLGLCKNYVCLDSDTYFIRNFYKSDFMFSDDVPYTLCHEDTELMEWAMKADLGFDIHKTFMEERSKVMSVLDRKGIYYDFGPSPTIWNCETWKSLFDNYIIPNKLTFNDLIAHCPSEFSWYGEWLLKANTIPIYPRQPLCKVFHYKKQYIEHKDKGYTEQDFSKHYLGIIMQSNWGAPERY